MHLRALIQGGRPIPDPPTLATVATLATLRPETPQTVATVATVAALAEAESWPDRLRTLAPASGMDWHLAADALDMLLAAGVVAKALSLGWDARELIGVCRAPPHDSPSRAGLIFSMRPGDTVTDVRRAGCIIAYGTVRHIWKRVPLPADRSLCMPWDLTV